MYAGLIPCEASDIAKMRRHMPLKLETGVLKDSFTYNGMSDEQLLCIIHPDSIFNVEWEQISQLKAFLESMETCLL